MSEKGIHKACVGAVLLAACVGANAAITCTVTTTPVVFGTYNPLNASPVDTTGSVTISCTLTSPDDVTFPYSVSLSQGSGSYAARTTTNGAQALNYNLYVDAARAQIWGDGTTGTSVLTGSMTLGHGLGKKGSDTDVLTTYARMPAGQDVGAGTYTDSITVTVTY